MHDPLLAYLFENQIAEADLVVYTKSDLYETKLEGQHARARHISAITGQGVSDWLDEVLNSASGAGTQLLDIDYARYAAAEAALGWLNWEAELHLDTPLPPASIVGPLLEQLDAALTAAQAPIAHLKIFDRTPAGYIRAGICRNGDAPSVEGDLLASPARTHDLVINLRAQAEPAVLEESVRESTSALPPKLRIVHQQCFQPSPPVPEHRYRQII